MHLLQHKFVRSIFLLIRPTTIQTLFQAVILLTIYFFSTIQIARPSYASELDPTMLKMLYTYKFGKFTRWPERKLNSSHKYFRYCILGQNQFSQSDLKMITGKLMQNVPISIEIFETGLAPKEALSSCHILFISTSERHRLGTILSSLSKAPILTVSDTPDFSSKGGMITLVEKQDKIRFKINLIASQKAELTISSKLLELAEIIKSK